MARIVELTAFHVRVPLRKAVQHASHTRSWTDNILIRCVLEDGTEGFGEGVPRDYVTGETIDSALLLLRQSDLRSQLTSPRNFPQCVADIERLQLTPIPNDDRGCQGNAARCALEIALLDAYGRYFREPLSAVTRILAGDVYQESRWVRYSGAIMGSQGRKARLAGLKLWLYGFKQVKVKVGIAGQDDVGRLRTIRRALGRKMDIRVDANEAWPVEEVEQRIRDLEPFAISAVEQPVGHSTVSVLAAIRPRVQVPIILDESLCSMGDAERAVGEGTCDLFNLRLSKCGGFIPSLRLAQYARQHGLKYQLGCQIGETAILSAAGRHFASSVGELRYLEGSYDRHLVREALGTKDLTFGWGGWASALAGPGLGIVIDPQAVERITIRKEALLG